MEPCDILIKGGTLLTMDNAGTEIQGGSLAIGGDRIVALIPGGGPVPPATKVIDAPDALILPGLVNAHTHAAMTLFRGVADDLPLIDWLNNYIFPIEKRMDSDFVYTGSRLACAEMILSGTTTFCDMYLFEEYVARAAKEAGMRALVGEVLYDFDSPNYGPIENGLRYTEDLISAWKGDPLISVAVEPHAAFTCSPELLASAARLAGKQGVPLIIHLSETRSECEEVVKRYGRSPVEHLEALGVLGPACIAAHCVHVGPREIDTLSENGVKVVHNPESNMKLASGIAPVPEMIRKGITVALGTDGCASNNNLDMFGEMDVAAKLHKVHTGDTTVMDAKTVLRMATLEGARSLGMAREIGSLEVGKSADVIIIDTKRPHLTPLYNPYSQIVYGARGCDVTHSIINGRLIMEDRNLLTLDLETVLEEAVRVSGNVRRWVAPGLGEHTA